MWQHITSVYFLHNKTEDGSLEDVKFCNFLDKITAFIFAYAITNPGVNALRTPVYDEIVNIVSGKEVTFSKFKFNKDQARSFFENYSFTNQRNVTRSIITWYAYTFSEQSLISLNEIFHLEHIYPKKRQEIEKGLKNDSSLDSLGNKILLESSINISASDYRFDDKKKIYAGKLRRGNNKEPSKITEIAEIIALDQFEEQQITDRNKKILDKFFEFLENENLIATQDS